MENEPAALTTPESPTPPPSPTGLDPRMRSVILTAMVMALMAVLVWSGNLRAEQTKVAELERAADALSEAIEPSMIADTNLKLERLVIDIATAANYREVSLADNSGKITASTNQTRIGKKSEALKLAPIKAKANLETGQIKVRRAIILAGDTRYGNLEVIVAR
jgi:hypothetical protein